MSPNEGHQSEYHEREITRLAPVSTPVPVYTTVFVVKVRTQLRLEDLKYSSEQFGPVPEPSCALLRLQSARIVSSREYGTFMAGLSAGPRL